MAGFADLVARAQPAVASVSAAATAGRTWKWVFTDINDDAGTPIDLTTATGTCTVVDAVGGATVTTLTFAGASGQLTVSKDESLTGGLGLANGIRPCWWELHVVLGGDDVQFWGVADSPFNIYPKV